MKTKRRVAYGVGSFKELRQKNSYFVDKTRYIELLENYENPVFLRPRRFGKSLWCSILSHYYDINQKEQFKALFGDTYVGQHPTPLKNSFMILHLDFSVIDVSTDLKEIEISFRGHCNRTLETLLCTYAKYFHGAPEINFEHTASYNLGVVFNHIQQSDAPPLYLIIDEYDSFANQLVVRYQEQVYQDLTSDASFFKTFFRTIKSGRQMGSIANSFITGVLPITMDDLTSAYNIAYFLTLRPPFASMLGYTQEEVETWLRSIYEEYELNPESFNEVKGMIKNHYNGYCFVEENEPLYNSTLVNYFLKSLTEKKRAPRILVDENLRIDITWIERLTARNPQKTEALIDQLAIEGWIHYEYRFLSQKFNMHQFFEESYFPISFFYLGMLTLEDQYRMKVPNPNIREIMGDYFTQVHHIDASNRYEEMMRSFDMQGDMEKLFADYWKLYISQFPEAIFQKVNENFYRSTFFELCSRFLSHLYSWNVERSYPSGKSDLEFVGKYHEKFAGLRWVIEFKYYSNAEFRKLNRSIEAFELQPEDTEQIAGYVEGLRREYPEAQISQFVVYCFGNQGFRVFAL